MVSMQAKIEWLKERKINQKIRFHQQPGSCFVALGILRAVIDERAVAIIQWMPQGQAPRIIEVHIDQVLLLEPPHPKKGHHDDDRSIGTGNHLHTLRR
jgi:hypothetical protein